MQGAQVSSKQANLMWSDIKARAPAEPGIIALHIVRTLGVFNEDPISDLAADVLCCLLDAATDGPEKFKAVVRQLGNAHENSGISTTTQHASNSYEHEACEERFREICTGILLQHREVG